MKRLVEYLQSHGFMVMMFGFTISVISLFVYMQFRHYGNFYPRIAIAAFFAGIAIYAIGRVFVAIQRKKPRKVVDADETKDVV